MNRDQVVSNWLVLGLIRRREENKILLAFILEVSMGERQRSDLELGHLLGHLLLDAHRKQSLPDLLKAGGGWSRVKKALLA